MNRIYECVPNVSEGRDVAVLDACAAAIEGAGVRLAHRTSDVAHHRSVFTFFGTRERVLDAALALARVARDRIDLRAHDGAHPRIGALDVLPFVPFADATIADARGLSDVRRGGFEALAATARVADVGASAAHPSAGAVAVGVREILVAFNVVLASDDLALARSIARTMRERDGGPRTLRALGIRQSDGRVQVSCNVTDADALPLDRIVETIRLLAAARGVAIAESELIGLVPRTALARVVGRAFGIDAPLGT